MCKSLRKQQMCESVHVCVCGFLMIFFRFCWSVKTYEKEFSNRIYCVCICSELQVVCCAVLFLLLWFLPHLLQMFQVHQMWVVYALLRCITSYVLHFHSSSRDFCFFAILKVFFFVFHFSSSSICWLSFVYVAVWWKNSIFHRVLQWIVVCAFFLFFMFV